MGTSGLENRSGRDERQGSIPIFSAYSAKPKAGRTVCKTEPHEERDFSAELVCFLKRTDYICTMRNVNAKTEEAEERNALVAKLVRR
jgi:hypothetical protein